MAIIFRCRCGKRLKACESSAGRRTMCPDCGEPVGIPKRQPTHRDAPDLPASIVSAPRRDTPLRAEPHSPPRQFSDRPLTAPPAGVAPPPAPYRHRSAGRRGGARLAEVEIRLRRAPRWLRLCQPSRSRFSSASDLLLSRMMLLAALAGAIALSAGAAVQLVPNAVRGHALSLPHGPFLILAAMAFACAAMYVASFIGQMVQHSVNGPPLDWQFDVSLGRAASHAARWLASFVCGPLLIAAAGLAYWLHCGQLTVVDWMILGELALLAVVLCLALWFGSSVCGRFAILCPVRASRLMSRVGRRGVAVTVLASALVLAAAGLAVWSLQRIQLGDARAMLWLAGCAFCGIAIVTWALSQLGRMSAGTAP